MKSARPSQIIVVLALLLFSGLRMQKISTGWTGKPMLILVNGEPVLAPIVRAPLGKRLVIHGRFTLKEAQNLAGNFCR